MDSLVETMTKIWTTVLQGTDRTNKEKSSVIIRKGHISAPGRYVAKATCREENGIYYSSPKQPCALPTHFDEHKNHLNVVINYHVPYVGVITIQSATEKEADLKVKNVIYEELTKVYLEHTRRSFDLEKLIQEVQ